MSDPELLTLPEASALLRLKLSTLRAWIQKRRIPHVKLGSRVFIRRSDIDALVSRSVVPAAAREISEAVIAAFTQKAHADDESTQA